MSIMLSSPVLSTEWSWNTTWCLESGGENNMLVSKEKKERRNSEVHVHGSLSMIIINPLMPGGN